MTPEPTPSSSPPAAPTTAPTFVLEPPEDAIVLESPAFGQVALFTSVVGGTRQTAKQVVIAPDGPFAVEKKGRGSLRMRILDAVDDLAAETWPAEVLGDYLRTGHLFTLWTPPIGLDLASLRESSAGSMLAPEVAAAFRAIAEALLAEIDEVGLLEAARRHFQLPTEAEGAARGWIVTSDKHDQYDQATLVGAFPRVAAAFLGAFAGTLSVRADDALSRLGGRHTTLVLPPDALPDLFQVSPSGQPDADAPTVEALEYMTDATVREVWVRPRFRATTPLVQDAALRAGIPASTAGAAGLPELRFRSAAVHAAPLLHALAAPGLELVPTDDVGLPQGEALAAVGAPLLPPWQYDGDVGASAHWVLAQRADASAAADAVQDATTRRPTRLYPVAPASLADTVASTPAAVLSALFLASAAPLPPAEYAAAAEDSGGAARDGARVGRASPWVEGPSVTVDVRQYRAALRVALLAEAGDPEFTPLVRLARRFADTAREVEALLSAALEEALDLGAPSDVVGAVEAPGRAAVAALRAATVARLERRTAGGEIVLAAVLAPDLPLAASGGGPVPADPGAGEPAAGA